ncbi:hypothetical protein [Nostoc sp.]|uniref:hypothetical protein n=1 Tax=Nostoc sp. TaxID=1180 RepID=UPI002FF834B3
MGSTDICATQPFTASLQVRVSDLASTAEDGPTIPSVITFAYSRIQVFEPHLS